MIKSLAVGALALAAITPLATTDQADARTLYGSSSTRCYEDGSCKYRTYLTIDRQKNPLRNSFSIIDNLVAQHVGPDAIVDNSKVTRRNPLRIMAYGSVAGVQGSRWTVVFTRAGFNAHPRSYGYVTKVAIQGSYCKVDHPCED